MNSTFWGLVTSEKLCGEGAITGGQSCRSLFVLGVLLGPPLGVTFLEDVLKVAPCLVGLVVLR